MRIRVLLTGATGFVGKQVFKRLLQSDIDIILVIRRGSAHQFESFKNVVKTIETDDLFKESSDWWAVSCCNIDLVINVAWYAEPGKYLTSDRNVDCLRGSLNLAEGCFIAGVERFVGVGSCAEYDVSDEPIRHDGLLKPLTLYAAAKVATFNILEQFFISKNVSFSWCRLFYLYGEAEDERRLVPYIRSQLSLGKAANLSAGYQVRDFINVEVAGRIIADVALSQQSGAVNVCSGRSTTVRDLAIRIAKDYGREDLLNFGARKDNLLDPPYMVGIPNWGNHE
jgi:dTDP-6-deoxy-L-talose 4-dehydrogenase (NAD+)